MVDHLIKIDFFLSKVLIRFLHDRLPTIYIEFLICTIHLRSSQKVRPIKNLARLKNSTSGGYETQFSGSGDGMSREWRGIVKNGLSMKNILYEKNFVGKNKKFIRFGKEKCSHEKFIFIWAKDVTEFPGFRRFSLPVSGKIQISESLLSVEEINFWCNWR